MSLQTSTAAQRLAFSPGELATLTGLSLSTVHRRLATGDIKFNRSGRRVLIPREELDRLTRPPGDTGYGADAVTARHKAHL